VEAKGASTDPRQAPPTSVQRNQAQAKNGLWPVPAGLVVGQKCLKPAKDAKGGKGAEWPQLLDLTRMLKLEQVQCTGPGTGGDDAASSSGSGGGSSEAGAAGGGSTAGGEASAKAALQRVLLRSPADASDVYTAVTGLVRSKDVAPTLLEVAGRGSHGLSQGSRGLSQGSRGSHGSSIHKKGGRSNRDTKSGGGLGRYLTRWDALWWNDETASGGNAEANTGSRRATKGGNSGGTSRGEDGVVGTTSGDQRFSYGRVAAEGGGGVGGGARAGTGSGGGSVEAAQPSRARVVLLNRRSMKYCGDEVPATAESTNTKTQEGSDVEAGKMTCSRGTVGRGEVFELTMLEPPAPSGAGAGPKAVVSLRSGRTGMFCRAAGKKKGVLCDKPTVGPKEHFQIQLVFFGAPAWHRPKPTTSPGPYVPPPDLAAEQSKGLPKPEAVFPLPLGGPNNHISGPPTKGAAVPSSVTLTAYTPPKQQPKQLWINATVIAHEMAVYIGACPVCKPADDDTLWQYRLSWRCMLDNTCGKHRCRVCALHQIAHPQCEKCPGPFAPVRNMAPPPLATPSPAAASASGFGSGSNSTSSSKGNSSSASSDAKSTAASGGGSGSSGSSADTPAPAPGPAPAPCNDPFGNFNLELAPKYVCGGGVAAVY
jgi:hypothetical protein